MLWVPTPLTYLKTHSSSYPPSIQDHQFFPHLLGRFHPGTIILSYGPSSENLPWPTSTSSPYLFSTLLYNRALQRGVSVTCLQFPSFHSFLDPLPSRCCTLNWCCQGHHDLHVAKSSGQFLVLVSFHLPTASDTYLPFLLTSTWLSRPCFLLLLLFHWGLLLSLLASSPSFPWSLNIGVLWDLVLGSLLFPANNVC